MVLSSLSVFANMFSFSCSGRQVLSASRALLEVLVLHECVHVCMCVENEGETPCNYKLLNTELPYHRLINSHDDNDALKFYKVTLKYGLDYGRVCALQCTEIVS